MEETKVLNANNRNVEPIPDINTDSKPDKKKVRQSQRSELALRLKPKLTQEAKERMEAQLKQNADKDKIPQRNEKKGQVREQLGEIAGVSGKIIDRVETILTKGTKEDIQALVLPLWAPLCLLQAFYMFIWKSCKGMRVKPLKIDFRGILYKGYIINAQ